MAAPPLAQFCGCCESGIPDIATTVINRPGLSAISYRIGTFATFRQAMLERIASEPAISSLTTRDRDDYAIAILELFAAVADVLCFYNERIANEAFIRTARERDSILRLVRLLGYRPRPGLAATAMVAFSLDEGATTRIRRGLRIMSIPGQDERAHTYETAEPITAYGLLNSLAVFAPPVAFNPFQPGRATAPILARPEPLAIGDRILVFGLGRIEEKSLAAIDRRSDAERLTLDPPIQGAGLRPAVAWAARADKRLRFFGHNAPDRHTVYDPDLEVLPQLRWSSHDVPVAFAGHLTEYPLDARYDDVKPGDQLLVDCGGGTAARPRLCTAVVAAAEDRFTLLVGAISDTVTHVELRQTVRGAPGTALALASPPGTLQIACRNGAGVVSLLTESPGSRHWESVADGAEAYAADRPAMVALGPHGQDLFYRAADDRLHQAFRTGAGWSVVDLGTATLARPAAVWRPGAQALVASVTVEGLRVQRLGAAGIIDDELIEGALTSPPAMVTFDGSRIDVVARGPDRTVLHAFGTAVGWSLMVSLGGTVAAGPILVLPTPDRPEVFIVDDHGRVQHRRFDGAEWSDWLDIGGDIKGEPACAVLGAGMLALFARGRDGALWTIQRTGATWGAWTSLAGTVTAPPAVAADAGVVHVVVRDGDGGLSVNSFSSGAWSGWRAIGHGLGAIPDRRNTRIFRTSRPEIAYRPYDYPAQLTGDRLVIPLAASGAGGLEGIAKGRHIVLKSGAPSHLARITARFETSAAAGARPDHLTVVFAPPVAGLSGDIRLLGNVTKASHGETWPQGENPDGTPAVEPLGNGDATKPFQSFRLSRGPLTHLPSQRQAGGEAAIDVRVNGELWQPVASFYGRGPTERVYTLRQDDAGQTTVMFGDGKTGSRPKSGAGNITARYRVGLGLEGRVKAGQVAIPLERPVGLRSVDNPLRSDGGADSESREDARLGAPASVKTFGRAVSLADFETVALASGLISRARASWVWLEFERAVHLTVAAAEGAPLSSEALSDVHDALTASRDPNRPLVLSNLVRIPIVVAAKLLREPAYEAEDIAARARSTLAEAFAFEARAFAAAVHASSVYARLQGVAGVAAVVLELFHLKGHADLTPAERAVRSVTADLVQQHIRVYPARPTPDDPNLVDRFAKAGFDGPTLPPVLAAEQAAIMDPAEDLTVTVVETL